MLISLRLKVSAPDTALGEAWDMPVPNRVRRVRVRKYNVLLRMRVDTDIRDPPIKFQKTE
jgi:hypothetical protein